MRSVTFFDKNANHFHQLQIKITNDLQRATKKAY